MTSEVDLRELAIDRSDARQRNTAPRRQWVSRYALPSLLCVGFMCLFSWAVWDIVFPPRPVTVITVISTTSEVRQEGATLFKAAGWIEPRPTPVRVAALAPGVVDRLLVVEDQAVVKGETIAELVREDAQFVYEKALAYLHLREAEVSETQAALTAAITRYSQPVHLEAALGDAQAGLAKVATQLKNLPFASRRAAADYEAARKDYQGKRSASDVVAGVQIDIAKGKLDSARAMVDELDSRLESLEKEQHALTQRRDALQTQLELLADEIQAKDQASARVNAAKARVEQVTVTVAEAKLQLDRMTICAPIDGRVFRLISHPGARIGSGPNQMPGSDGSTVVTMYDPHMLQIRVDVRFEDVPKVQLDQLVEINNPTLASAIMGRVLFVSSEADIQKNTLQVKVAIPDPPPVFKPEMLVDVTFLAPKPPATGDEVATEVRLYLPKELIVHSDSTAFVWVADQSEGIARKVQVETGSASASGFVEIISGLTAASRIITNRSPSLGDGDRITTSQDTDIGLNGRDGFESNSRVLRTGDLKSNERISNATD